MLSKIYESIALLCIFLTPAAVESEMYIAAAVMICGLALFAYLSMKEDGMIRKRKENSTRQVLWRLDAI